MLGLALQRFAPLEEQRGMQLPPRHARPWGSPSVVAQAPPPGRRGAFRIGFRPLHASNVLRYLRASGRLAQLVQSTSFTPRGSGVRVPHRPPFHQASALRGLFWSKSRSRLPTTNKLPPTQTTSSGRATWSAWRYASSTRSKHPPDSPNWAAVSCNSSAGSARGCPPGTNETPHLKATATARR